MKIAIIGSGISGLYAAWRLSGQHEVTIFEKNNYFGGHTDTHAVKLDDATESVAVDTGFIVFNEHNYPLFSSMLRALKVPIQASDMSFSVNNSLSGLCYNPSRKWSLLARPQNFLRRDFRLMIKDLLRFYAAGRQMQPDQIDSDLTLTMYLDRHDYSQVFRLEHLYPMCGALWSTALNDVGQLPLRFVMGFFQHHRMLQLNDRPAWLTVKGGSSQYIRAIEQQCCINWRKQAIDQVKRFDTHVELCSQQGTERFDWVIFATHADDTLQLLAQPSSAEQQILGAFGYQNNIMVLHTDAQVMPRQKSLWASWHVRVEADALGHAQYSFSYWMNTLQNLSSKTPVLATLNPNSPINRKKVLVERAYRHPHFNRAALDAQQHWLSINGQQRSSFCGAYWGWGFHEDGARSAERVVNQIMAQASLETSQTSQVSQQTEHEPPSIEQATVSSVAPQPE